MTFANTIFWDRWQRSHPWNFGLRADFGLEGNDRIDVVAVAMTVLLVAKATIVLTIVVATT